MKKVVILASLVALCIMSVVLYGCAGFGGDDRKDLYVTTSSLHFEPKDFEAEGNVRTVIRNLDSKEMNDL